jgi:hypothetical protein
VWTETCNKISTKELVVLIVLIDYVYVLKGNTTGCLHLRKQLSI